MHPLSPLVPLSSLLSAIFSPATLAGHFTAVSLPPFGSFVKLCQFVLRQSFLLLGLFLPAFDLAFVRTSLGYVLFPSLNLVFRAGVLVAHFESLAQVAGGDAQVAAGVVRQVICTTHLLASPPAGIHTGARAQGQTLHVFHTDFILRASYAITWAFCKYKHKNNALV